MMDYEQQAYEVSGRQLGWRASQLQAQGLPYNIQPMGGGVYIVIVQQPAGVNPFAYQPAPRHRLPRFDTAQVMRWVLVAAVVGVLIWTATAVFSTAGGKAQAGRPAQDKAVTAWQWLQEMRPPWESKPAPNGEPVVERTGWRWPWESAQDAVQGAVNTGRNIVAGLAAVLGLLAVGGAVAFAWPMLARRRGNR